VTAAAAKRAVAAPRDAAGVVVLRDGPRGPEVLLGCRSARARFMPGVYVFPGGRLDPLDRRASGFEEALAPPVGAVDGATRRKLAALARCALREVWEETGLLLGRRGAPRTDLPPDLAPSPSPWPIFAEAGLAPAFEGLRLAARAITPAVSPVRYHTRFFLLEGLEPTRAGSGDGELADVGFVPTAEALQRPMSSVTALVLAECMARRRDPARPSRLFAWRLGEAPIYR
jgi:8-oxo-dGTP pyrophosphatase MutT (NUDIX family)